MRKYKIITDFPLEKAQEKYSIFETLDKLNYEYEVITSSLETNFIKMKQLVLSRCDKNTDVLIIMINTENFLIVKAFISFLYNNGFTYTGVTPEYYDQSREAMKQNAELAGVLSPNYCFLYKLEEEILKNNLKFPLFVKTEQSYASVCIDEKSKVNSFEELHEKVYHILNNYGGVLIEEFIDGREFSVLVYGNEKECIILDPVEYVFGSTKLNFLTENLKNNEECNYWYEKVKDETIIDKCKGIAKSLFKILNTTGYFRIDIRMKNDEYYMLEYNDYPSLFLQCGSTMDTILKCNNVTEDNFLNEMTRFAINNKDTTEVKKFDDIKYGRGLFSTKNYNVGDTINDHNCETHFRCLSKHSDKYKYGDCFRDYAYNLNSDVFAVWSDNPEQWRNFNHSCDPNTKFTNFMKIAIKPIKAGEEITIDYNTFYIDFKFECNCKSSNCKKNVSCLDYSSAEYQTKYKQQDISPYIRTLQNYENLLKILNSAEEKINVYYDRLTDRFSVIAKRNISNNEVVFDLTKCNIISKNNIFSITKNDKEYFDTTDFLFKYTNHSCCPNIQISQDGQSFMSLKDILMNEEITFNYNTTELILSSEFFCSCGSNNCKKNIKGFKFLDNDEKIELLNNHSCSPYIKQIIYTNE